MYNSCLIFSEGLISLIQDEEGTGWNFNNVLFFDSYRAPKRSD